MSGVLGRTPQLDDCRRSLSAPVCAEVLEQTLVYKGVPRAVEPETDPDPAQTAADLPADGDSFDGA